MRDMKGNFKTFKIGIREIHKLQSWVIPVTILNAFVTAIAPFVNIYMSAKIINELVGSKDIERLILLVALTIGLNFIIHLLSTGLNHLKLILTSIMVQNQDMRINEKIIEIDYEHVENPEVHKLRTKIKEAENVNGRGIYACILYLEHFIQGLIISVVSISLVRGLFNSNVAMDGPLSFVNTRLFTLGFLGIIILGTIINLRLRTISEKSLFTYFGEVMDMNRNVLYYFEYGNNYHTGKDIRLYNQRDLFKKKITGFVEDFEKMFNKSGKMRSKYDGIDGLISSLLGGLVYIFVGLKAIIGTISVGSIVQYTGSIHQFMAGSTRMLSSINSIINNNQYLQLYLDFLNIEGEKYKGTLPIEKRDDNEYEVEFKNVSFKYPGTEKYVLKNISMKLNIGQRLAIVGMNGSGKTTFIKLLSRLYDPNEGEILLNGINIKKYDYDEYLNLFSIVFQDFKLFSFSLGQNVASSVDYSEDLVVDSLEKAGLNERLNKMPKGIETPLYKNFDEDGVEISGGEAQKIGLARALYRDSPIIILDEPTAALDPIAEFEIYSKFNEIVGTKTAFYISHRLSSCRFCDEIAVFHEGKIIQKGKHDDLLVDIDGKYYELWNSQAQYYKDEVGA